MLTLETRPSYEVPGAPNTRGSDTQALRTTVRLLGLFAAMLAFGLLGLVVGTWHLTRGRRRADPACHCCRRRRHLALVGTVALAGLVLLGTGMTVNQHHSRPGLPRCATELPGPAAGNKPGHPLNTVWLRARQVLTAPVSGLASRYVDNRGGGLCEGGSMTLAFLPSAASHSAVTVGGVVLTGTTTSTSGPDWEAMASHESRHITQWALLTLAGGPLAMPILYTADNAFFPQSRNHFERAAGLQDGGYPRPDDFGPRPQWSKVTVIGLLLVATGRRRLRWASRVLTGGARAAEAHHPGLCPVHSPGWFRLPTGP